MIRQDGPLNAFCVDLEEWFHAFGGIAGRYADPNNWEDAPACVVKDTETIMRMLDRAGARGTFLTVGWVARKYPDLIRRLAHEGHEIGCHSYWHRLVYTLTPEEFEKDLTDCLEVLRGITGQPVDTYRAPGFSVKAESLWCYPILRKHGIITDISVVPAKRDHGGIHDFPRDPFMLETAEGDIRCFPVSVMTIAGRKTPFSGGGYLRLFPLRLIEYGFKQNHAQERPGMLYIHPREVNPDQPRFERPPYPAIAAQAKYFKYYVNLRTTQPKLEALLARFQFGTVREVLAPRQTDRRYKLVEGGIDAC